MTKQQEVRKILEENNWDFHKIAQDPELREKVNLQGFDFEGARKLAQENPIELIPDTLEGRVELIEEKLENILKLLKL